MFVFLLLCCRRMHYF